MQLNSYPEGLRLGLLPEQEGRSASFITSTVINLCILALAIYIGITARHVLEQHKYEQTELIFPTQPPPPPKVKVTPPKLPDPPKMPEVKLAEQKINLPTPKPEPKRRAKAAAAGRKRG